MKKKLLSLILCLSFIFGTCLFVACNNVGAYKLSNFKTDYEKVVEDCENVSMSNGVITLNYGYYGSGDKSIKKLMSINASYAQLKKYDVIFANSMSFVYQNYQVCSADTVEAPAEVKNDVYNKLKNFDNSLLKVSSSLDALAEILNLDNDVNSVSCKLRLSNVYELYEELICNAIKLNDSVANLYFNHVLTGADFKFVNIPEQDFNAEIVINNLSAVLAEQKVRITDLFLETNLLNSNNINNIINNGVFASGYNAYLVEIATINKTFDNDAAIQAMNDVSNKSIFYKLSVEMGNIINNIKNMKPNYDIARADVEYVNCVNNADATVYQLLCVDVVDNFNNLSESLTGKLFTMLTKMGV